MQNNALFVGMTAQPCMISRLRDELREASREFRQDPRMFVTSALRRDAVGSRRKMLLQMGLATALLLYAIAFLAMLVFWSFGQHQAHGPEGASGLIFIKLPGNWQKIESANGDDKPAGGGGGGGNQTSNPASVGQIPISSLDKNIVAPKPEPPLTPPVLPIAEHVMVDPRIQFDRDDLSPTGLPDGVGLTPSAGPGSGRGMGTGSGAGMGPGDGPGVGPGSNGNTGGDGYQIGIRKLRPAVHQTVVDERPVLLNNPRPMFTEEARRNKIQGVVRMRILVDVSGKVAEVVVTRGLPDGLDSEAIRAAYQMRFKPAMKSGSPVSYWMSNVEVEFNLR